MIELPRERRPTRRGGAGQRMPRCQIAALMTKDISSRNGSGPRGPAPRPPCFDPPVGRTWATPRTRERPCHPTTFKNGPWRFEIPWSRAMQPVSSAWVALASPYYESRYAGAVAHQPAESRGTRQVLGTRRAASRSKQSTGQSMCPTRIRTRRAESGRWEETSAER